MTTLTRRILFLTAAGVAVIAIAAIVTVSALGAGEGVTRQPSIPGDALRVLGKNAGLRIGTAVNMDKLNSDEQYTTIAATQFSTVTPENVMKWEAVEPQRGHYDWSKADKLVAFAQEHGQLVRGHNLVWNSQLPEWLNKAAPSMSKDELKAVLKKHVIDEVTHFKGKIWQWDVVNEATDDSAQLSDDIWYQALGEEYIADAFTWAHEADPGAKLFLNNYGMEFVGPKADAELALAKKLKAQGVPIDGVGFEAHLDVSFGMPDIYTQLSTFADAGFDVAVTELDVRSLLPLNANAVSEQNDVYAMMLNSCLQVPRCISFTVWGFEDTLSWIPEVYPVQGAGDIYDHYEPKSEYAVLQQVLKNAPKTTELRR